MQIKVRTENIARNYFLSEAVRCSASQKRPSRDSTNSTALDGSFLDVLHIAVYRNKFCWEKAADTTLGKNPDNGPYAKYYPLSGIFVSGSRCPPYRNKEITLRRYQCKP